MSDTPSASLRFYNTAMTIVDGYMTVNSKQQVDMIRHDHIVIYRNMVIKRIHLPNVPIRDFPMLQQLNMRR